MLEQAESILAAVEEMPGLTRMDGNSHKCHFVSVLFKLFGQVNRYIVAAALLLHRSYYTVTLLLSTPVHCTAHAPKARH
jgi:hypothetical protein